ncbi:MAG: glycerol-3-phosphate 1-O-acyltransferase PlsY [Thermostichales cyanobacterium SRBZ-1_bins_19]
MGWLLLLLGYVLGSLPTGYLAGKWLKGIDLRRVGSGSTGATNVLRSVGKGAALAVLVIDGLKGALAVLLPGWLGVEPREWWRGGGGVGGGLGRCGSGWVGGRGGKSVATSLGVLLALSWGTALSCFGVWVLLVGWTRWVSLGSVGAAITAPLWMLLWQEPLPTVLFGAVGGVYVVLTHWRNLQRLLAGTEPKLGQKTPSENLAQ